MGYNHRLNGIDFFKFFAAISVVLIHTGYGDTPTSIVVALKLSLMWAVPFFFMVSGFFLAKKITDNNGFDLTLIENIISKLFTIFILTSIIYIPVLIQQGNLTFGLKTILTGTYFHLWFLGSLIFSYFIAWFFYKNTLTDYLKWAVPIVLIGFVILNSYVGNLNLFSGHFIRFSISIPFFFLGIAFYKKEWTKRYHILISIILIIAFFILQIYENNIAKNIYDRISNNTRHVTLLFSTIILTFLIFHLAVNLNIKNNLIVKMGREYSLLIYLFHPLCYKLMNILNYKFEIINTSLYVQVNAFICIAITIISIFILDKLFPKIFTLLNGDIRTIKILSRKRPAFY